MPKPLDFSLPEQPPFWRELYDGLRDRLRRQPEPDLHLESTPVPVKDIWAKPQSTSRRLGSVGLHVAVLAILMLPIWKPVRAIVHPKQDVELFLPTLVAPGPSLPKMRQLAGGGVPLHKLAPPKLEPVNAPKPLIVPPLKLAPATAMANLPIPQFGDPGVVAGPPGKSMGLSGAGPGGPGNDANGGGDCVSGPCAIGGDVSEPVPIYEPDPEYSDAARKAKFQGTVVVGVIIGTDGHVYDPRIVQPLGLGLDQKALQAVLLWRFEPAKKRGRPVRVAANIEVNFHLY